MIYDIPTGAVIKDIDADYAVKLENSMAHKFSASGLKIRTDKGNLVCLIENGKTCCENFGWGVEPKEKDNLFDKEVVEYAFSTPDKAKDFLGAKILSVEKVESGEGWMNAVFLNINTDKGLLQYAVYNYHNGYYAHDAVIKVFTEREEISL